MAANRGMAAVGKRAVPVTGSAIRSGTPATPGKIRPYAQFVGGSPKKRKNALVSVHSSGGLERMGRRMEQNRDWGEQRLDDIAIFINSANSVHIIFSGTALLRVNKGQLLFQHGQVDQFFP